MSLAELALSAQHPVRKKGLPVLGEMSWGSHCCHFFQTQRDLLETLLPYFKVGLEAIHPGKPGPQGARGARHAIER
jgi:hypothetical protein